MRESNRMSDETYARFDTSSGEFLFRLFAADTPRTTRNFVELAEKGFYDGVIFHRVIDNFMIQGGDPTGTGRGGPGYSFEDEFSPRLRHDRPGILSMANAGPNTNGSQFFITLAPTPHLNNRHSVFGEVVEGMEVVKAIGRTPTNDQDRPLRDVVMRSVRIERRPASS
jgi:cyclophilin family peptidyl-prolyl cis-trans isomerase